MAGVKKKNHKSQTQNWMFRTPIKFDFWHFREIFFCHIAFVMHKALFLAHSNQQQLWDGRRGVDALAGPTSTTVSARGFRVAFGLKLLVSE